MIVVYDGINGCGKTTMTSLVAAALGFFRRPALSLREPGGTVIGEKVRALLKDPGVKIDSPLTQILLFYACRAELVNRIMQHDGNGLDVVMDRWWFSTYAYQGALGADEGIILWLGDYLESAMGRCAREGFYYWLDVPAVVAVKRAAESRGDKSADRWEREGIEMAEKVRGGYAELAERHYLKRVKVSEDTTLMEVFRSAWGLLIREIDWRIDPKRKVNSEVALVPAGGSACPNCLGAGRFLLPGDPPTTGPCRLCSSTGLVESQVATEWMVFHPMPSVLAELWAS